MIDIVQRLRAMSKDTIGDEAADLIEKLKAQQDFTEGATYSTPCDEFEAAIKKFGIVAACEWFGYTRDSEFTAETVRHFAAKSQLEGCLA